MSQSIIIALVGLGATIIGALITMLAGAINNYYSFRLNEPNRQLDLFKIAYPELVAATKNVAKETRFFVLNLTYFINDYTNLEVKIRDEELIKLQHNILDVILLTASYEWLFTSETNEAVSNFHSLSQNIIENWATVDKKELDLLHLSQTHLVVGLRRQLHMNVIHNISFDEESTRKRLWRHRGYKANKNKRKSLGNSEVSVTKSNTTNGPKDALHLTP